MTAPCRDHDQGPDPTAVDTIQRIVDLSQHERLSLDDEMFIRMALQSVVIGGDEWSVAFGLDAPDRRCDGVAEVRRRLALRALQEAAEILAPGGSVCEQVDAILNQLETPTADDRVLLLLRRADALLLRGIPRSKKRATALLEGRH